MQTSNLQKEQAGEESSALRKSVVGYLFMAAIAIAFSFVANSDAIALDGAYNLVSVVMAVLARRVAALAEKPGSESFQFGYAHFEPLLNTLRILIILLLCSFAFVSAVSALLHGGRDLEAGPALTYGIIAASFCLILAYLQGRTARRVNSPTLKVDARNWFVDGIISLGVGLAFLVALLIQDSKWDHLIAYVDPGIVVILVLFLVWVPLRSLRENLREVLMVAPDAAMQQQIREGVESALEGADYRNLYIRMAKIGRRFFVTAHVVVAKDYPCFSVRDIDRVRRRIIEALADVRPRIEIDAIITADEEYASNGR